jgi:hypothetical protein
MGSGSIENQCLSSAAARWGSLQLASRSTLSARCKSTTRYDVAIKQKKDG